MRSPSNRPMKIRTLVAGAFVTVLFVVMTITPHTVAAQAATGRAASPKPHRDTVERDLVQTAIAAGQFKTLVRYIKKAGLADTLSHWGPFTIFAPTDAAFASLPKRTVDALMADPARLRALLQYHIFVGSAFKHHILDLSESIMMQGDTVKIHTANGGARLNERASVLSWTLRASNGVIHTIDRVLVPPARQRATAKRAKSQ